MSAVSRSHSRGFTLVEMLVALVVMSVGMLGIAGLFVTSLHSGSSSIYRMQAVNLASDLADRIRANRRANVSYQGAGAADANNCAAGCSADQMAANDLAIWHKQIAATLPAGAAGTVAVTAAGLMYTYNVKVAWTEPGEPGGLSYTLNFQL